MRPARPFFSAVWVLVALAPHVPLQAAKRPNFLLIIADDMCWRDTGFTGNRDVHTPNIDRLAAEGMSWTTMFSPATTCSPSRHALYTGLYCVRAGAYPNHTRAFDGTKSIFTHLQQIGYRTALQNKTHVGPPASFPYEHLVGADDLTKTREFIERDPQQPWMLAYASNDPHGPWNRGDKSLYDASSLTVPEYLHDNEITRTQLASYYAEISMLDTQVGNLMKLLEEVQQVENTLVMFVSEQGSSFPYGGKWSVYDNGIRVATVVRWPGRVAPGSTTEALMQYVDVAPTFLAAAGAAPESIDTGCPDANGDRGFDGVSFLDVLTGKSPQLRSYVFSQHTTVGINGYQDPYPMRAVRDARYKLIRNLAPENTYSIGGIHKGQPIESWREDAKRDPRLAARVKWLSHRPATELYDLQSDPLEMNNLSDHPELSEVRKRLQNQMDLWMKQQGDRGMETELNAKSRQGKRRAKQEADSAGAAKKKKNRKKQNSP